MQLAQLLEAEFNVSGDDIKRAENFQNKYGGRLEQILVNMGSLPDDQIPSLYSLYFGLPLININEWIDSPVPQVDDSVLTMLLANNWLPLSCNGQCWTFACIFPLDLTVNEWLSQKNIDAEVYLASDSDITVLSAKLEQTTELNDDQEFVGDEEDKLRELATEAPTVNLLNSLARILIRESLSLSFSNLSPLSCKNSISDILEI